LLLQKEAFDFTQFYSFEVIMVFENTWTSAQVSRDVDRMRLRLFLPIVYFFTFSRCLFRNSLLLPFAWFFPVL